MNVGNVEKTIANNNQAHANLFKARPKPFSILKRPNSCAAKLGRPRIMKYTNVRQH